MARYKPIDCNPRLLPVMLSEQIQPGTFEFALDHLVDNELDLSALDARFCYDATGASAYDPRVMLKIVLRAYSRGLISSRRIEAHQRQDAGGDDSDLDERQAQRVAALHKEAQATRDFLARSAPGATAKARNSRPISATPTAPRWPPAKA